MERKKHYFKAIFEIFILVVAIISFSYLMHESYSLENNILIREENKINLPVLGLLILKVINKILWDEKNFVSALEINSCELSKTGQVCVEYLSASECLDKCAEQCIPTSLSGVNNCKLGSCFDPVEGTCQLNSPKRACESNGGTWINDVNGNVAQCKKGCCIHGNNANFWTEQQCKRMSEISGIEKDFRADIRTEFECIVLSGAQEEGACLTGKDVAGKNNCKFATKAICLQARGEFYSGYLCSNAELNTNCVKQKTSSCVEGKDEIYWFDSCGNRENIYDANKERSWNNGKVLGKDESCSLASGNNYLANQGTCGNCNFLLSSRCGNKTATERLSDAIQKDVCRSLTCRDDNGNTRQNGETWCVYQGAIGVDGNRAVDTPGSRHFMKSCMEGEVRVESCGDYRTKVCVESETNLEGGGTFSSAACVPNLGDLCVIYNTEDDRIKKCNENPFCFVKEVDIAHDFSFKLCAPKYPVGHDLATGEGSSACALASQKCTAVKVKKTSGWKWEANEDCTKPEFAQKMNNLCMSLGDCGAEVNYVGDLTENYAVRHTPRLGEKAVITFSQLGPIRFPMLRYVADPNSAYLNNLKKYSDVVPGQVAEMPDIGEFGGTIGIPNGLGEAEDIRDPKKQLETFGMITGGAGALLWYAAAHGISLGALSVTGATEIAAAQAVAPAGTTVGPSLSAAGGAIAGAAIGAGVTSWLISATGIGAGMSRDFANALITAGAIGGALLGYAATATTTAGWVPVVGWIIVIIVVMVIVILRVMGVGEVKKIHVNFKCYPWEPPRGGEKCEMCGDDGLPCSEYACSALGQTCRFVNEGTSQEKCINIAPNDISPPVITPWQEELQDGLVYQNPSDLGVNIRSSSGDGCIAAYSQIKFGLLLDKYGKCRYSTTPNKPYEEMTWSETEDGTDTGDDLSVVFQKNITVNMRMPSMEMLGLPSYDPNKQADYTMYVKCENGNGYVANRDYAINFCIKPGEDLTAPAIIKRNPAGEYVKAGASEQNLSIWTNKPSNCKWDNSNKNYSAMLNNFTCANGFDEQELFGWRCDGTIPLPTDETTINVKCENNPWQNDSSKRVSNSESTPIKFKKTTPLIIDSASPDDETLVFGVEPASVEVKAETSGGISSDTMCGVSFDNGRFFEPLEGYGNSHSKVFESFSSGKKFLVIKCDDIAGNIAFRNISFEVSIDRKAPEVTRIYADGSALTIKTDENAECSLSMDKCDFAFENGTLMSGSELAHTSSVEMNKIYYVMCKDDWDNSKGACNKKIKVIGGITQQL